MVLVGQEILKQRGRPKLKRNAGTLDPAILRKIATEALDDGRLVVTREKLAYCLQVTMSTVQDLLSAGALPVVYLNDDLARRWPRVPVLALLDYLDNKTVMA